MAMPQPHVHRATKIGSLVNISPIRHSGNASQTLPLDVPAQILPTGETICIRCDVHYCCRALFLLHLETSIDHNLCIICHYTKDFATFTELQDHLEQVHLWCEACNWSAPSYQGLEAHFHHKHMMCMICKLTFRGFNELSGHINTHRPLSIPCFLCKEAFSLQSAVFNHIESGKCPRGATPADMSLVVGNFWKGLSNDLKRFWTSQKNLFSCQSCHRQYNRLSDLLQHKESQSCPAGYENTNSITERLVQYVQKELPVFMEERKKDLDQETTTASDAEPYQKQEIRETNHELPIAFMHGNGAELRADNHILEIALPEPVVHPRVRMLRRIH